MGYMVQKYIVEDAAKASPLLPQHVALVNPDGSAFGGGNAPGNATTATPGLVKKASAVASVASPDVAAAAGETVTKAEFAKAVAVANECKKQLNALLANLKAAGITA